MENTTTVNKHENIDNDKDFNTRIKNPLVKSNKVPTNDIYEYFFAVPPKTFVLVAITSRGISSENIYVLRSLGAIPGKERYIGVYNTK